MRFKTDENLHPEVAELLRQRGHDAMTVWDQGLRGHPDSEITEACQREGRALVTLDLDFGNIMTYPPQAYPGLIVLRINDQSRRMVLQLLARALPFIERKPIAGLLLVIDEVAIRVRGEDQTQPRIILNP